MAESGFFKPLKDNVSSALIEVTRTAGKVAAEDLAFHRSSNPAIAPLLDNQTGRLLQLVRNLTQASTAGTEVRAPRVSDVDTIEDKWHGLVDIFDSLLEKADACLDEYTGVIKRTDLPQELSASKAPKARPPKSYRSQILPKPQLLFKNAPKNHENTPFKPLLRSKPHSIQPLEASIRQGVVAEGLKQYDTQFYLYQGFGGGLKGLINTCIRYGHPYQAEIETLRYPDFVYHDLPPIPFLPFDSTAATFVDTPEAVALMLQELKSAKEIAVDLEHHDTHSYIGLTSLMQISTRDKDWIVDTLQPWREELQVLNEVFADPSILKVFHGAFMDMIWLQRDLGIYVVGLFDTFHASKTLGYPKNSLAALLAQHANFNAAKQYQMADWRIRPLPEEMFNYARSDTHFLLYVYDILRNELLARSELSQPKGELIDIVLAKSKEEALQRYERPFYDVQRGTGSSGWYNLLSYTPALFNREQFAVFRAVHQWRDTVARLEDESLNTIMPKHVIYNIAREMPLEMAALLGCSQPISTFVRSRAGELLGVVKQAKIDGATGPDLMDTFQTVDPNKSKPAEAMIPMTEAVSADASTGVLPSAALNQAPLPSAVDASRFWGPTLRRESHGDIDKIILQNDNGIRLELPLPQLTAEIFADPDSMQDSAVHDVNGDPGARAEHAYVKERRPKDEDIFVVRQLGGPKKRKATDIENSHEVLEPVSQGEMETAASNGGLHPDEQQEVTLDHADEDRKNREKAERKAERKAQKKSEKKRRKLGEQQDTSNAGEEAAFDYANAPSILHAKQGSQVQAGMKPAFNPYLKSLDTSKGVRHSKKEAPGRSLTYKS